MRQKEHRTLGNDEILLKFIIIREILQWWNLDEEKNYIGCWSIMKNCWNWSSWKQFQYDLILIAGKSTSDVGQWWNIVEIHDAKRDSRMIWLWWREKVHRVLVNDQVLLKFIIFKGILKWSYFDEEKKFIGCWWMMKYGWNWSSSEKF